jgi:hypothetical protein
VRYWSGVITGVAASAIAFFIGLTSWLVPRLVEQVPALFGDEVPRATSMVTGAGWAIAAPAALVVLLLAATILPRRRETVQLVAVILALVATAAVIGFTLLGISVALADVSLELRAG